MLYMCTVLWKRDLSLSTTVVSEIGFLLPEYHIFFDPQCYEVDKSNLTQLLLKKTVFPLLGLSQCFETTDM